MCTANNGLFTTNFSFFFNTICDIHLAFFFFFLKKKPLFLTAGPCIEFLSYSTSIPIPVEHYSLRGVSHMERKDPACSFIILHYAAKRQLFPRILYTYYLVIMCTIRSRVHGLLPTYEIKYQIRNNYDQIN